MAAFRWVQCLCRGASYAREGQALVSAFVASSPHTADAAAVEWGAILAGAALVDALPTLLTETSYRGICTFIKLHRRRLNRAFKIAWERPPAHTAIRYILQRLKAVDVEKVFREHAANLNLPAAAPGARVVALDGKTLKGSFDTIGRWTPSMLSAIA